MKLESLLQYIDGYLGVSAHPDYATALNGLQVDGPGEIHRLAAAVDASESVVAKAVEAGVDLLVVHHGMFWDGLRPITGRRYRKLKLLMDNKIALYSVHLPLDGHPEVGNGALLARSLGIQELEPFGEYKGVSIGWRGSLEEMTTREGLRERVSATVERDVHVIPGGPEDVQRVAVVTGGGGSFAEAAADAGVDALVTGEGTHHTHVDAMELGVNVYFGGHYATETFGVKALAAHLAERFGLEWSFIHEPTGL